jgi:hypothetical protein
VALRILKRVFGYIKVRYRGIILQPLERNLARETP